MQFFAAERRIALSVGELAAFRTGLAAPPSRRSVGRAALGQAWHNTLRTRTAALYPEAQFEVVIKASLPHRGWVIEIEGRIDQAIPEADGWRFTEVKSITLPLPMHPSFLLERYPAYACQAVAYACMARSLPAYADKRIETELLFVEVQTGITQALPLGAADEGFFYTQLEALIAYAEDTYLRRERIHAADLSLPYPELRPEQTALLQTLKEAPEDVRILALEAPTGFGKTGITLYWALEALKAGHCERIIYLTGKTTGQWAVERELARIIPPGTPIRSQAFRSREDHSIRSPLHTCDPFGLLCNEGLEARWQRAGIQLSDLFDSGSFSVEAAKKVGHEKGLCPYALSRSALALADVWVSDYNYVFSPAHSGVFENQIAYEPGRTLLIVDEAHNLPTRVADALSGAHTFAEAAHILEELRLGDIPAPLMAAWENWVHFLEQLPASKCMEESLVYTLLDVAEKVAEMVEKHLVYPVEVPSETRLKLWQAAEVRGFLADARFEKLIHSPQAGTLTLTCLDARRVIRAVLDRFGKSVLMSATLAPLPAFIESCGLKATAVHPITAPCPWRDNAYNVALDTRLDTRFRLRPQAYDLTAETLAHLKAASKKGPAVGFFPSYAYAEAVYHALKNKAPTLNVALQPPMGDLASQTHFLKRALEEADILLLVLGSRFSESVDLLGGHITHALVAGPGLPAMSTVEEAARDLLKDKGQKAAFRTIYQIPAMRKVHQALGRLVRSPQQTAHVLLHCQRFGEHDYHNLLDPTYHPKALIKTEADLIKWLGP